MSTYIAPGLIVFAVCILAILPFLCQSVAQYRIVQSQDKFWVEAKFLRIDTWKRYGGIYDSMEDAKRACDYARKISDSIEQDERLYRKLKKNKLVVESAK